MDEQISTRCNLSFSLVLPITGISTHTSLRDATSTVVCKSITFCAISTHTSLRDATEKPDYTRVKKKISTHTSLRDATVISGIIIVQAEFLLTHLYEMRLIIEAAGVELVSDFYSHISTRCDFVTADVEHVA